MSTRLQYTLLLAHEDERGNVDESTLEAEVQHFAYNVTREEAIQTIRDMPGDRFVVATLERETIL